MLSPELTARQETLNNKMEVQRALMSTMIEERDDEALRWIETYSEAFGTLWDEAPKPNTVSFQELGNNWLTNKNPADQQKLVARLEQRQQELRLPRAA